MNRRQFLKSAAAGTGALLSAPLVFDLRAEVPIRSFDPFEKVPLGRTGLKPSRLCLGTGVKGGQRSSNHTRMGQEKFNALVRGAFDRGVTTFDLADLYGTHSYFAEAMKGVPRDKYLIITKQWFRDGGLPEKDRPDADVVVKRFLQELKTDYVDLMLLHCVTSAKWPEDLRRQMDILSGLKQKGMIKALGVSCHSLEALEAAVTEPWVESVHARINPFGLVMDGPAEKVTPVLKRLHDAGKGVVGMKIVGEGKLRNEPEKIDQSIRFVLGLGTVDVMNVGCENLTEVDDFAARIRKVKLT
jgi:aryl-alcohol dehydrogenase-like predicted oxidoreductase